MADVIDEVLQNLATARGVRDFGMKLQAVEFSLRIFDRGERRAAGSRRDAKPIRQRCYFVTVTIPDIDLRPRPSKSCDPLVTSSIPAPYITTSGIAHLTTEMMRHLHQAVTNSQDRNSETKNLRSRSAARRFRKRWPVRRRE